MNRSVGTKIGAGFGLALAILIVIGVVSYRSLVDLIEAAELRTHTSQMLKTFEGSLSHVKDAEVGQRDYIITGEERYLEPYHTATAQVDQLIDDLRKLTADNPNQQ